MKVKKEISYEVINFTSFIAAILGIPSSILSIIAAVKSLINGDISYFEFIFGLVLIILVIIFLSRFLIYKKKLVCLSATYPTNFRSFMSYCRNCYFEIITKNSNYSSLPKEKKIEDLSEFIVDQTEKLLDNISELFGKITSEDIFACIKLIPSLEVGKPLLIQTLSRSSNTDPDRKVKDGISYPLKGNTDFEHIFNDGHRYFYSKNLEESDARLEKQEGVGYENNSPNYTEKTKRYKSTIVVPLKVDKS